MDSCYGCPDYCLKPIKKGNKTRLRHYCNKLQRVLSYEEAENGNKCKPAYEVRNYW